MSSGKSWIDNGEGRLIEVDSIEESVNCTVVIVDDALFLTLKM